MTKMTDDELLAIADAEIASSVGRSGSKLSQFRLKALQYYNGEKVGALAPPESEGRSQIVSKEVADTIEWIMPSLMEVFTAGDDAVKFEPQGPEDVDGAEQSTDWVNYVFYRQNPGFIVLHNFLKDALMQRLGVVKTYWDDAKDVTEEEYQGLDELEMLKLAMDPQIEIIEQTTSGDALEQSTMLTPAALTYDVKVKRTKDVSQVRIEGVPPEEFFFSPRSRSGEEMPSCGHRVRRTISQLKKMGYENTDELDSDDCEAEFDEEAIERADRTGESWIGSSSPTLDNSMRMVWITELYIQVDYNGDGIAEWRKVVKSGKVLLDNEEVDGHPFAIITPILMPHELVGVSVSDLVMDLQEIKTALTRQIIDNMFLQNNPRLYVDENAKVNIDDLLDSRVGGIVRGRGANGVTPLATAPLNPASFSLLEYIDTIRENRTGVTRYNQGMDANSLNKTATGVNAIMNAAQQRTKLIARVCAETGIKSLLTKILKLSAQNQKKQQVIRLRNEWVEIDPRSWKNQYDIVVNVGLGTGNKDQAAAHLMNVLNVQKEAMAGGLNIVTPKNIYNVTSKLTQNMGFKNPDEFWTDPDTVQPQPKPPSPEEIKAQAEMAKTEKEFAYKDKELGLKERELNLKEMDTTAKYDLEHTKVNASLVEKRIEAKTRIPMEIAMVDPDLQEGQVTPLEVMLQQQGESMMVLAQSLSEGLQRIAEMQQQSNAAIVESLNRPKVTTITDAKGNVVRQGVSQ